MNIFSVFKNCNTFVILTYPNHLKKRCLTSSYLFYTLFHCYMVCSTYHCLLKTGPHSYFGSECRIDAFGSQWQHCM